jgi:hypothetical protein
LHSPDGLLGVVNTSNKLSAWGATQNMLRSIAKDPWLPLHVVVIKEKQVQFYLFLIRAMVSVITVPKVLHGNSLQLAMREKASKRRGDGEEGYFVAWRGRFAPFSTRKG